MLTLEVDYKPDEHLLIADGEEYQVINDISINFNLLNYCTLEFNYLGKNGLTDEWIELEACIKCLWSTAEKVLKQVKSDKNFIR